jgi:hypothetical protein
MYVSFKLLSASWLSRLTAGKPTTVQHGQLLVVIMCLRATVFSLIASMLMAICAAAAAGQELISIRTDRGLEGSPKGLYTEANHCVLRLIVRIPLSKTWKRDPQSTMSPFLAVHVAVGGLKAVEPFYKRQLKAPVDQGPIGSGARRGLVGYAGDMTTRTSTRFFYSYWDDYRKAGTHPDSVSFFLSIDEALADGKAQVYVLTPLIFHNRCPTEEYFRTRSIQVRLGCHRDNWDLKNNWRGGCGQFLFDGVRVEDHGTVISSESKGREFSMAISDKYHATDACKAHHSAYWATSDCHERAIAAARGGGYNNLSCQVTGLRHIELGWGSSLYGNDRWCRAQYAGTCSFRLSQIAPVDAKPLESLRCSSSTPVIEAPPAPPPSNPGLPTSEYRLRYYCVSNDGRRSPKGECEVWAKANSCGEARDLAFAIGGDDPCRNCGGNVYTDRVKRPGSYPLHIGTNSCPL